MYLCMYVYIHTYTHTDNALHFLRQAQQFQALRQVVQRNPAMLQALLQQIGQNNPQLLQVRNKMIPGTLRRDDPVPHSGKPF